MRVVRCGLQRLNCTVLRCCCCCCCCFAVEHFRKLFGEGGLVIKWSALHSGVPLPPCAVKLQCYASVARLPSIYVRGAQSSLLGNLSPVRYKLKYLDATF